MFPILKLPDAMGKMNRAYPLLLNARLRTLTIKSGWLKAAGGGGLIRRLSHLSGLQSVEVTGGDQEGWTDLLLSGLGSHCPQLQSLKVSHCSDLTESGLRALCGNNSPGYVEPQLSSSSNRNVSSSTSSSQRRKQFCGDTT